MASLVDWRKGVAACDVAVCYRIRSCIPLVLGKVSFHRWFELSDLKKMHGKCSFPHLPVYASSDSLTGCCIT